MSSLLFLRPVLALVFVCSLIGLAALLAKKFRLEERLTSRVVGHAGKQLSVVETLVIDPRRKLVLVKRGNISHLLLLGPGGDTVIEANIPPLSEVVPLHKIEGQYAGHVG